MRDFLDDVNGLILLVFFVIVVLVLFTLGNSNQNAHFDIKGGNYLLENIAKECEGELTVKLVMSLDAEIVATCTQEGSIDGTLIKSRDQIEEK